MIRLGVNIDHIATLRQARCGTHPDPVDAARICVEAGADSIVAHLREDRRHIQDADVRKLKKVLQVPLNLEMSCARGIVDIACRIRPDQATLVPENRRELTTEGGLDVVRRFEAVRRVVRRLQANAIPVSLFIEPRQEHVEAAVAMGAKIVELHTGSYAQARTPRARAEELERLRAALSCCALYRIRGCAGHGLDYGNVSALVRLPGVEELNIGYSIICRCLWVGLARAVREMKSLMR